MKKEKNLISMLLILSCVVFSCSNLGASRTYRLGDYSVSTWQNQFDFGNNYFTIQTYCADYYDPISNTINYDFKYLSPNDMFFNKTVNSAVKKYNKGAYYAY